jgi:hypothetical protein
MIFWGKFLSLGNNKKNWKKLGIFVFKGKLDPKTFNFFEKKHQTFKTTKLKNNNNNKLL